MMQPTIQGRAVLLLCFLFPLPTYGVISEARRKINANKLVAGFARSAKVKPPTCIVDMIGQYYLKTPLPKKEHEPFWEYVEKGEMQSIERLFQMYHIDLEMKDHHDRTPLHWAACQGQIEVVKLLLGKRADMSVKDRYGTRPLHFAAKYGSQKIVALLLDQGADKEARDHDGCTPLHWAAWKGQLEVVRLLLDEGADVHAQDRRGDAPLHWAVWGSDGVGIIKLLLAHGAYIDVRNRYGYTPLHGSTENGNTKVLKILIEHGADMKIKNVYGYRPLCLALKSGQKEAIDFLKQAGKERAASLGKKRKYACSSKGDDQNVPSNQKAQPAKKRKLNLIKRPKEPLASLKN